ncbi:MAG: hypothetical protein R2838_06710 [Caldilineaceae bacterium]
MGLAYVKKLVSDSLGLSRPVEHPAAFGLDQATVAKLGPTLDSTEMAGRITGMTPGSGWTWPRVCFQGHVADRQLRGWCCWWATVRPR